MKCRVFCCKYNNGYQQILQDTNTVQKKRFTCSKRSIFCIFIICSIFTVYFTNVIPLAKQDLKEVEYLIDQNHMGYFINTPTCKMPNVDPLDKMARSYLFKQHSPNCNQGMPPLYEANHTSVYMLNSSQKFYSIDDINKLECCYRIFWRKTPSKHEADHQVKFSNQCYQLNESARITEEFIKVVCNYANTTIYVDMFSFVPLKTKHVNKTLRQSKSLNILIMGMDGLSRLNLRRQMPKTVDYLRELGAVEMMGYNKVEDNTYNNLIPVLTGLSAGDLETSCMNSQKDHFDRCHFIWQDYKAKGFITAFGEDTARFGLFEYQRHGFINQSTDYWYSYFERHQYEILGNLHFCVGSRLIHQELLRYINKFLTTINQNRLPYFAFFWECTLSHDHFNGASQADENYRSFFQNLNHTGYLENTVFIFMSDHGIRNGDFSISYPGAIERRLPILWIKLPETYKNKYKTVYDNLKNNANKLTSPFDLHATLTDLLNPFDFVNKRSNQTLSNGISLLREIPDKRNCNDAHIPKFWCACLNPQEVDNTEITKVVNFVLTYINNLIIIYKKKCKILGLKKVLNAQKLVHDHMYSNTDATIQELELTIATVPGNGMFNVAVRYHHKYAVIGKIMRVYSNLTDETILCDVPLDIKPYCFC